MLKSNGEGPASQHRQSFEESVNRLIDERMVPAPDLIACLTLLRFRVSTPFPITRQTNASGDLHSADHQPFMTVRCHGVTEAAVRLRNTLDRFNPIAHGPRGNMLDKAIKTNPRSANLAEFKDKLRTFGNYAAVCEA